MRDIRIRQAAGGGYIISDRLGREQVYTSLEAVFGHLLTRFEGRALSFEGDSYGNVIIIRGKTKPPDLEKAA